MHGNQISWVGASALAAAFAQCKALETVDLNTNKIDTAGGIALATAFAQCESL